MDKRRDSGSPGQGEGESSFVRQYKEMPRRRRRKPEVAEGEILDAAEAFLKERPFRDMTVEDVMSRTGLSRPSFYEYFRDRHQLVRKLVERLADSTYTVPGQWLESSNDSLADLRESVERMVSLYAHNGYLLRALADAAADDGEVEQSYRMAMDRLVEAAVERIRAGIERGVIKQMDASEVGTALVLMNDRYLIERFSRGTENDQDAAVETIVTIWRRVLYGL